MTATLSIAGDDVRLTLSAAAPHARDTLKAGEPALRSAFERVGLTLLGVAVPQDRAADAYDEVARLTPPFSDET
jgi:hypothetical protein